MSGYEDNRVVSAAVNGLHSEINGEGENVTLKAGVSITLICYFEQCLRLVVNFPAEFLDDETDVHYELPVVREMFCVLFLTHFLMQSSFVPFTHFCLSLLILPAAVVHQRVTRRKLMAVGSRRGSRRSFPQERLTVLHLLTTTSRYYHTFNKTSLS